MEKMIENVIDLEGLFESKIIENTKEQLEEISYETMMYYMQELSEIDKQDILSYIMCLGFKRSDYFIETVSGTEAVQFINEYSLERCKRVIFNKEKGNIKEVTFLEMDEGEEDMVIVYEKEEDIVILRE